MSQVRVHPRRVNVAWWPQPTAALRQRLFLQRSTCTCARSMYVDKPLDLHMASNLLPAALRTTNGIPPRYATPSQHPRLQQTNLEQPRRLKVDQMKKMTPLPFSPPSLFQRRVHRIHRFRHWNVANRAPPPSRQRHRMTLS
jgi:hypothetical protein